MFVEIRRTLGIYQEKTQRNNGSELVLVKSFRFNLHQVRKVWLEKQLVYRLPGEFLFTTEKREQHKEVDVIRFEISHHPNNELLEYFFITDEHPEAERTQKEFLRIQGIIEDFTYSGPKKKNS